MHEQITLTHASGATAAIAPGLGLNCFSFRVPTDRGLVEVLDAPADFLSGNYRPSHYGIPLLFPFPNRIQAGRYTWQGQQYQMPLSPGHPHAIHGFALDRAWQVTQHDSGRLVGEFLLSRDAPDRRDFWPADGRIEVEYELGANELTSRITVENMDRAPFPWGFGTHAYFRMPLLPASGGSGPVTISAPAHAVWELNECIPTGRVLPVPAGKSLADSVVLGALPMDDVFTDLRPTGSLVCGMTDHAAGLRIVQTCDASVFRELVVYTPAGRNAVCMEPYTCVTNAINLATQGLSTGWQTLAPGESCKYWIKIALEPHSSNAQRSP